MFFFCDKFFYDKKKCLFLCNIPAQSTDQTILDDNDNNSRMAILHISKFIAQLISR